MRTVYLRAIRQRIEFLQAVPHLRHCAFKNPSTAQRKKTVTDKSVAVHMIGNMAQRMPANIQNAGLMRAQHHHIALINGAVKTGYFIGFTGRAGNGAAGGALNFFIIAGMVIMMMGVPICVNCQPVSASAAIIGAVSGVSIHAVSPLSVSCTKKP